jgi:hypothetical protein
MGSSIARSRTGGPVGCGRWTGDGFVAGKLRWLTMWVHPNALAAALLPCSKRPESRLTELEIIGVYGIAEMMPSQAWSSVTPHILLKSVELASSEPPVR